MLHILLVAISLTVFYHTRNNIPFTRYYVNTPSLTLDRVDVEHLFTFKQL